MSDVFDSIRELIHSRPETPRSHGYRREQGPTSENEPESQKADSDSLVKRKRERRVRVADVQQPVRPYRRRDGTFAPGTSGNPNGRPLQTFDALVRHYTGEGEELVEHAIRVMRGEATVYVTKYDNDGFEYEQSVTPTIKDQQDARNWLAERGWGKAPQLVHVKSEQTKTIRTLDLSKVPPAELRSVLKAMREQGQQMLNDAPPSQVTVDAVPADDDSEADE